VSAGLTTSASGETAHTLILVGLILQGIQVAIVLGIGFLVVLAPGLGGIIFGAAAIGILWIVLVYSFSYRRTEEGDYEGARTPTLVFGILSLLGLGLISGILYLVAYSKLGDAIDETTDVTPPWNPPAPISGMKYCPACGRPSPSSSRYCQSCGARFL
jgi:hypothetical protein